MEGVAEKKIDIQIKWISKKMKKESMSYVLFSYLENMRFTDSFSFFYLNYRRTIAHMVDSLHVVLLYYIDSSQNKSFEKEEAEDIKGERKGGKAGYEAI